jgi:hypothetical protein
MRVVRSAVMIASLVASSDCERIHDGLIAQPVNAASSVAYVIAGALLVARARRVSHRGLRGRLVALGVATAANGVGGVAYHGPGGAVSKWVHDGAVLATVALVVVTGTELRRVRWDRAQWRWIGLLSIPGAVAGGLYVTSRTGGPLCSRDSVLQGHAGWHVLTALLLLWWGNAVTSSRLPSRPASPTSTRCCPG